MASCSLGQRSEARPPLALARCAPISRGHDRTRPRTGRRAVHVRSGRHARPHQPPADDVRRSRADRPRAAGPRAADRRQRHGRGQGPRAVHVPRRPTTLASPLAEVAYRWKGDDPDRGRRPGNDCLSRSSRTSSARPELALDDALELAPLKIPTGTGLSFRFEAADNDDVERPQHRPLVRVPACGSSPKRSCGPTCSAAKKSSGRSSSGC